MDTKGDANPVPITNNPVTNLANIPLMEELEDGVVYIAVKGSLYANDCSVFGLANEELKALVKKFPSSGTSAIVNGLTVKANVLSAINSLAQLGYTIVCSTGDTEITWTLKRQI